MKIETYRLGEMQANCYVLYYQNSALIIDPGSSSKRLISNLKAKDVKLEAILLTHGHFDHIAAVDELVHEFSCDVYIHENDAMFLKNPKLNCSAFHQEIILRSNAKHLTQNMEIGPFHFQVDNLAGHTNGSCFFIFEKIIFSGDILFKGAIGRYDLPTGSLNKTKSTIQKIKSYPLDCKVYPGHGETTTILDELKTNPYFID